MPLFDYVQKHAIRGACLCGQCDDAPANPQDLQPSGHTINLTFFSVAANGGSKEEFLEMVKTEYPDWLDGEEHSYLHIEGDVGDQGLALITIGLGHLLGAWTARSPDTMLSYLPNELKQQMAGAGMVTLQYKGA